MNTPPSSSPSFGAMRMGFVEFVALLALCMSMVAFSIDSILPAFNAIGETFVVERENDRQFLLTFLFAGLAIGQLIAGPLSDSVGRKKAIYIGLGLFIIGSLLSCLSQSFEMMLAGRFIQGMGAAGPRIISIAMVRDLYEGREMARVMSFIMGVFIFVPVLAPSMGQGIIMLSGSWRAIFLVFILTGAAAFLWLALRGQETLHPEDRRPFTLPSIWGGVKAVCSNKMTLCYMIAAGCVFGAFIGYLNSSQQIFQGYYGLGPLFPVFFAIGALAIGAAFFVNARYVRQYGMRYIVLRALLALAGLSVVFISFELLWNGHVPLWAFMAFMISSSFCMGMMFGNFNALAMEPMGHMAGIASAVIGCVSLVIAMTGGLVIGQFYNGTLMPISGGFLALSVISLMMMFVAERPYKEKTA